MPDVKISALPAATTPLGGTEILPVVQNSVTKNVTCDNLTVKNIRSNATSGVLQVAGMAANATRVMTVPDANFVAARTDAAQTFTGLQTFGTSKTGNLLTDTNTIQAQDTNGNISILPNGTGVTKVKLENYRNIGGQIAITQSAPQATLAQLTLNAGTWLLTSNVSGVTSSGLGTVGSEIVFGINTSASIPGWNSTSGSSNRVYYTGRRHRSPSNYYK